MAIQFGLNNRIRGRQTGVSPEALAKRSLEVFAVTSLLLITSKTFIYANTKGTRAVSG